MNIVNAGSRSCRPHGAREHSVPPRGRSAAILLFTFASDAVSAPASERKVCHLVLDSLLFAGLLRLRLACDLSRSGLLLLRLSFVTSTFLLARHVLLAFPLFILTVSCLLPFLVFPRLPPDTLSSSALISRFTLVCWSSKRHGLRYSVARPIAGSTFHVFDTQKFCGPWPHTNCRLVQLVLATPFLRQGHTLLAVPEPTVITTTSGNNPLAFT